MMIVVTQSCTTEEKLSHIAHKCTFLQRVCRLADHTMQRQHESVVEQTMSAVVKKRLLTQHNRKRKPGDGAEQMYVGKLVEISKSKFATIVES